MSACEDARMGHLIYAATTEYAIEDRALAHLKAAVGVKLRLHETFFVSWSFTPEQGSGRVSLWCGPSIPMIFRFSGSRPVELNPVWVEVLTELGNSSRGIQLLTEHEAERYHAAHHG
ncbi:DUF7882 family protein [Leucobacter sp. HY1910]